MLRRSDGFTLIELMIVVVIIGILAAIAIPNFNSMQGRAKEGALKANMHNVQLAAEDYGIQNDGIYADDATVVVSQLPAGGGSFRNPFGGGIGSGVAWEDRGSFIAAPTPISGLTSYADSSGSLYNVKGRGKTADLTLILSSGQ